MANGVRFDWLTFDEWYGGKPGFLFELDELGQRYVCEVPRNFLCWPTRPRYHSKQSAFAPKRVDHAARQGGPFRGQKWKTFKIPRKTLPDQKWRAKAGLVHLVRDGRPTDRRYWLVVAENLHTGEVKRFIARLPIANPILSFGRRRSNATSDHGVAVLLRRPPRCAAPSDGCAKGRYNANATCRVSPGPLGESLA